MSKPITSRTTVRAQRGVSLVEAMVAMLVLSIGMLGIAGLYVESLRAGRSALLRTQAVMLAADMADRIRSNPLGRASYNKPWANAGALNVNCNSSAGACAPAQMAQNDIAIWTRMVDDDFDNPATGQVGLPNGQARIQLIQVRPFVYQITIQWQEATAAGPDTYDLLVRI